MAEKRENESIKRLFFGLEIEAPWPQNLPQARSVKESCRHLTLAFLGNIPFSKLRDKLDFFPKLPIQIGPVGQFDACLFLPQKDPHVIAWHVNWLENSQALEKSQHLLNDWLRSLDLPVDDRPFLPHVTLGRSPFNSHEWKNQFVPLPLIIKNLHLYESTGQLNYEPIWSYKQLSPPFVEIEHTADMAFEVYGETIQQIYRHAFIALSFHCPSLLKFYEKTKDPQIIDEVIMALNQAISLSDAEQGCSFKAVSFHGELQQRNDKILQWEMIVDV